jgi:hypothetical protein
MTTQSLVQLSFSADRLLTALATGLGPEPCTNEWLDALLTDHPGAAAEAEGDLDLTQLETAAHDRLALGEKGEVFPREEVAARAGHHAAEASRDVVSAADVAFVLLEAARDLVAAPSPEAAPEPEPAAEPAAVPLSFGAEQLLRSLFHGEDSAPLGELLVALVREQYDAAGNGLDLDALETAAREQPETQLLARDRIVLLAAGRAVERGSDVVSPSDVTFAILQTSEGLEPTSAEEAPAAQVAARAEQPRVFRLFVSSTFKDLEEERNVLRERVYPALREFCEARGASFQDIDLRWGVSEEASLDQQAMNICLGEIDRCREVTPRPNFLVLLGNRYGWLALPPQIPEEELDQILAYVPDAGDQEFLGTWYQRDANAVPAEYRLRPRAGEWAPEGHAPREQFATRSDWEAEEVRQWEEAESRLRRILTTAVAQMNIDECRRAVYETSATEQEIAAGALEIGAPEGRAFCFVRELELTSDDPDPEQAAETDPIRKFVDPDQSRLRTLKGKLESLPGNRYGAGWDRERNAPSSDHLEQLAEDVLALLEAAIERELAEPYESPPTEGRTPRIRPEEQLDAEGNAHRDFADERIRFFVGRDDVLEDIGRYLDASDPLPLVVHGEGGTGKSALLAEALSRAQERGQHAFVYRFIGATPASSDGRGLLQGICRELLARGYGAGQTEVPAGYQDLAADFRERLKEAAGEDRPLVLFLDSVDQLAPSHGARGLNWIPDPLPENVRLVVSSRPGETLEPLAQRLERAGQTADRLLELGPMMREEGDSLLELWLEDAQRTLRPHQRDAVLTAFAASKGNPLYLRLAFEEARRWISEQAPEQLAEGVIGIIGQNTFARLADEENHGEVLVSHALGYLAASRHGLAEDELLDLLSRDPDVYRWFMLGSYHVPLDLRERLGEYLPDGADAVDEWVRQVREGERPGGELDEFLENVLPSRGRHGLRLPVVLWSRLYSDLRPYLAQQAFEDAVLIGFYHRELGGVAQARYLGAEGVDYHARLARYFRPDPGSDGRPAWATASRHGLSELPFHLAESEGSEEQMFETLTDFRFLEEKATRVGVVEQANLAHKQEKTYTGVFQLQDDFELALAKLGGGKSAARQPLIVTPVDLGEGLVVRCPWCNTSHPFQEAWLGDELPCPACNGPLKVNPFVAAAV